VAAYDAENFPAPKVRERVTFVSMRVPNSLLDQVEAVCTERGIDRTALILHLVRQGLRATSR
jgi:hypothetical protein